jgi:4'-phosphopantetheinyl transferase EntD
MDQKVVFEAWSGVFPKGVFASSGKLECDLPLLSYRERISIGLVNNNRMLEFASGRMHARKALEKMGLYFKELPKDKLTGAPVWPKGVVGSITHVNEVNNSHVAAAVASSEEFDALGIDVECSNQIHPSIWNQFLTPQDFELIALTPVAEKIKLVSKVWSLKEAAIKATGQGEMTSWFVSPSNTSNTFKLTCMDKKLELNGKTIIEKGLVLAFAYMYKKHNK